MRNLADISKWSFCVTAAALAACSSPADRNNLAEANVADANAASAENMATPAEANESAVGNSSATFAASGSEPFWSLTLSDARMVYDSAEGPDVTVATPKAQNTRTGPVYSTPELKVQVDIVRHCTFDDGETKGDTVKVTVGGQTVTGCGNGELPN